LKSETQNLAVLGSTGSIGRQTLQVVKEFPEHFRIEVLSAHGNPELLIEQAGEFRPNAVVISDPSHYKTVFNALDPLDIKVFAGEESLSQVVEFNSIDKVVMAIPGFRALKPAMAALSAGKVLAMANKECLVAAGKLLIETAINKQTAIIPVDSEQSALFQCLMGENRNRPEKVFLTASGGPFRGRKREELETIDPQQALNHPVWKMGTKVSVDSATLMNKGLEVIEASFLFGLKPEEIEVLIHPQSVIHGMVQFTDGSIKALLSPPDMRSHILYALSFPQRLHTSYPRFSIADYPFLSFEKPDYTAFPCLQLAYRALESGGNMPCILNAANEIAVEAFLSMQIGFNRIPDIIEECMDEIDFCLTPDMEALETTHTQTQELAMKLCGV